ncbi:uncharacterized protein [Epargyreus clarus]|uniref:uncharacterized protein n=1 Tax=Epargyreus clarus TaxID=520877 RepID=UPI003C2BC785
MDKTNESKKCFCSRCFLPVDPEDRVDIEGQNFHRTCSMCCVCRTIPKSLKMFYGHVFCESCFKTHVLSRLKGDSRVHSNSWWMQWAPTAKQPTTESGTEEAPKRGICARCLQPVDECCKVQIGDQIFHRHCAQCYFCRTVPTSKVKIYYGQVFCEDCFHRYVLNSNKDNPSEFFRSCFETWQNNAQFSEHMREFMSGNKESSPFVFMMQGTQPFYRCGPSPHDWFQANEPKKSATATPGTISIGEESYCTVDLSFENRTEVSEQPESSAIDESANQENLNVEDAAEKIEKLTKYLHEKADCSEKYEKKWKSFAEQDDVSSASDISCFGWIDLQDSKVRKSAIECPKCLWQYGPIFVSDDYLQKQVVCGDN